MSGKIFKIGFFVLLIINIALVSLLVAKRPGGPGKGDMRDRLSNQLGLDESQKATFMDMAQAHRNKIREIEKREGELIKSYFDHILNPESIRSKDVILEEIQALKKAKLLATYQHFEALKGICTEEQQVKFEAFMNKVIPMISGGRRHRMKKSR
ncbi:MAG: hypothetical protein ABJG47_09530 [Ekhidna sp.]